MGVQDALDRQTAQSIIRHLGDGVVPDHGLEYFTVGRDKWMDALQEDLEDVASGEQRLRVLSGRYGDGKTHLMRLLSHKALEKGLVVSYVTIDRETPLSRWDRVYAAIVRNLSSASLPDRPGFAGLLDPDSPDEAIAVEYAGRAATVRGIRGINPDFATAVYRLCTRQTASIDREQEALTLRGWLEGLPFSKRVLKSLGISAAIDRGNAVTMLSSLVKTLRHFGYRAALILVDEIEGLLEQSKEVRNKSYETLRLLLDRETLPAATLMVLSATQGVFTEEALGFQSYQALWGRLAPIGETDQANYRNTVVDLGRTPLGAAEYRLLGKRIREVHSRARDWRPEARVSDQYLDAVSDLAATQRLALGHSPTRVYVKLVTNELEIAEQNAQYVARPEELERRFVEVDRTMADKHDTWDEEGHEYASSS